MRVFVAVPPEPVVSLAEAKAQLRVRANDEDAYITGLVAAATAHLDGPDGWLGRAIGRQTLEFRAHVFRDAMSLPYPPIAEIVSVKHLTGTGVEATVQPSEYELRGAVLGAAFGRRWPSVGVHPEAVRIQYLAGYETVPAPIKQAILLMVAVLFAHREDHSVEVSTAAAALLAPYRVWR